MLKYIIIIIRFKSFNLGVLSFCNYLLRKCFKCKLKCILETKTR